MKNEIVELNAKLAAMEAELAELRAYKEAAEGQRPVCYANPEWIRKMEAGTILNRAAVASGKTDSQGYSMPLYAKPVPADRPARITEQDAREIGANFYYAHVKPEDEKKVIEVSQMLSIWMSSNSGKFLLSKLNADREQVPAVAVPDGWKLVPIEPNQQQIEAMMEVCVSYGVDIHLHKMMTNLSPGEAMAVYSKLLESAPSCNQKSAPTKIGFSAALTLCEQGFTLWANKPHNKKWVKRIDGTPIQNDLLCCIAEAFSDQADDLMELHAVARFTESCHKTESAPSHSQQSAQRELNDDTRFILGRPNFWCNSIAVRMRELGHEIPRKAEDEQAHVINLMLDYYERFGGEWRASLENYLRGKAADRCLSHESEQGGAV